MVDELFRGISCRTDRAIRMKLMPDNMPAGIVALNNAYLRDSTPIVGAYTSLIIPTIRGPRPRPIILLIKISIARDVARMRRGDIP
jgi:hypothetical protein